jgi:hypothetical protein
MAKKLTPISVEKARANPDKRIEIPDAGKPGLYLLIQPTGSKPQPSLGHSSSTDGAIGVGPSYAFGKTSTEL